MNKQIIAQRSTVTVEDRRHVLLAAQVRKPKDVAQVPHDAFIRNALKDRMGWDRKAPAPQAILDVAREMAAKLRKRDSLVAAAVVGVQEAVGS